MTMCMDLEGNKSDEEEQIPYDFTYMWNLKNKTKQNKNKLIDTENRLLVTRREGGWGEGEMGEGDKMYGDGW